MRDQVDLATRRAPLQRAQLIRELHRGQVDPAVGVGRHVRTAVGRVRVPVDLVGVVAEGCGREPEGRTGLGIGRRVDSPDRHELMAGST